MQLKLRGFGFAILPPITVHVYNCWNRPNTRSGCEITMAHKDACAFKQNQTKQSKKTGDCGKLLWANVELALVRVKPCREEKQNWGSEEGANGDSTHNYLHVKCWSFFTKDFEALSPKRHLPVRPSRWERLSLHLLVQVPGTVRPRDAALAAWNIWRNLDQ